MPVAAGGAPPLLLPAAVVVTLLWLAAVVVMLLLALEARVWWRPLPLLTLVLSAEDEERLWLLRQQLKKYDESNIIRR